MLRLPPLACGREADSVPLRAQKHAMSEMQRSRRAATAKRCLAGSGPPAQKDEATINKTIARARTVATMARVAGARWREHASGALMGAAPMDEAKFLKLVVDGGEVLQIPRRVAWTQAFSLRAGASLRWEFRVQANDLGFALRRRAMQKGGAVEVDVVDAKRFPAGVAVAGDWTAIEACTVVAAFDNSYSFLTPKRVVAKFSVNDPTPKAPVAAPGRQETPAYIRRRELALQERDMAALAVKLGQAKVEGARLKELAILTPKAQQLPGWTDDPLQALGSPIDQAFDSPPPAPSTKELLAFLDTYDDGQRPAFPDEVLPSSEFPPPPEKRREGLEEVPLDDRAGESTL